MECNTIYLVCQLIALTKNLGVLTTDLAQAGRPWIYLSGSKDDCLLLALCLLNQVVNITVGHNSALAMLDARG